MTKGRAWACMNEVGSRPLSRSSLARPRSFLFADLRLPRVQVDFGAAFPPQFGALLAHHITDRQILRAVALGKRFTPPELLAAKIVDETVDGARVVERAIEVAQEEGGKVGLGSWGGIRVGAPGGRGPEPGRPADCVPVAWAQCGLYREVIAAGHTQQMPAMPYQVEADFYKRLELNGIRRDAKL